MAAIPDDSQSDTPLCRNHAEGCTDMTGRTDHEPDQRMWCGVISAGIPAEKRRQFSYQGPPVRDQLRARQRTDPWARLAK